MNVMLPTARKLKARSKGTHWKKWDNAILRVSVGYNRFEGHEFDALLRWLIKPGRFKDVILLVSDRLAAHNIQAIYSKNSKEATEIALKRGYEWQVKTKNLIETARKRFDGDIKIIDWRDAKRSSEQAAREGVLVTSYDVISARLDAAYDEDEDFRHFVHMDIDRFVTSRRDVLDENTIPELKKSSVKYIMEELAVHSVLRERYADWCHVYPGSQLKSERYLIDNNVRYSWCSLNSDFYIELRLE